MGEGVAIGEFSRRTGLAISALRFYDARGVFQPAWVDPSTGYRLYSESQIDDAALVAQLRRLGLPLRALKEFLASPPAERRRLLREHVDALATQLDAATEVARRLHTDTDHKETAVELTLKARDLRAAIEQVLPAVSTDPERPVLMSMFFESKDASVRVVGTDSYRLAVRDLPGGATSEEFQALVPAASIQRLLPLLDSDGDARLQVEDGRFALSTGAGEGTAGVLRADYVDYERLLDAAPTAFAFRADKTALGDALAGCEAAKVARLRFSADHVTVASDNYNAQVAGDYDGPELELGIDPTFAAYAVRSAVGPDIVLEADAPETPVLFRSADDGTFVCMVMPVRLL